MYLSNCKLKSYYEITDIAIDSYNNESVEGSDHSLSKSVLIDALLWLALVASKNKWIFFNENSNGF